MKKLYYISLLSFLTLASQVTGAQAQTASHFTSSTVAGGNNFKDFIQKYILSLLNLLIPIIASLALLSFFWGLAKFISKGGSDKSIEEGRSLMVWGTVALFCMVSVWGIIRFVHQDIGFGAVALPLLPSEK